MTLLYKGRKIKLDPESVWVFKAHKWFFSRHGSLQTTIRVGKTTHHPYLHRFLLCLSSYEKVSVDHINGNPADNRFCNLRIVTQQENLFNSKLSKRNTSGAKGVSWFASRKVWRAYVTHNKKFIFIGYFKNKKDAAQAHKNWKIENKIFDRYNGV